MKDVSKKYPLSTSESWFSLIHLHTNDTHIQKHTYRVAKVSWHRWKSSHLRGRCDAAGGLWVGDDVADYWVASHRHIGSSINCVYRGCNCCLVHPSFSWRVRVKVNARRNVLITKRYICASLKDMHEGYNTNPKYIGSHLFACWYNRKIFEYVLLTLHCIE